MNVDSILAHVDANLDESLERLFALLRIPSISTDPAYTADCRRAADWLVDDLATLGFAAETRDTEGHPVVLAKADGPAGKPRILLYGHYDVQPVDPLDLWQEDPFAPRIVTRPDGGKMIVARGACDDKGQLMSMVEALRAIKAVEGELPVPVTVLFEGEEESGSPSLPAFFAKSSAELRADAAFVCDTGMWDPTTPAIAMSLRGLVAHDIIVRAANRDLHSGQFGGPARNPNHVLAKILADLHDEDGSVTIPGFYEGVTEPSNAQKANWDSLGLTAADFLGPIGLSEPAGETGRTILEQVWSRPTCEVNGMSGGYTGAGFKTVIPGEARAKVSFRLVGDQDAMKLRAAFKEFVEARIPSDCSVEFIDHGAGPAFRVSETWSMLQKGAAALEEEWGKPTAMVGMGGSIPIVHSFKHELGMDTLMIGFALEDDNVHSPNEKYDLTSFHKGIRSWVRVFASL
ncbi:M20/M25/M40 family metallo-hydrolase [Acuticoccus sp. MNP-M23]|uniref:M20/M25/M40 family metallo-hydrolase n=1 Tax=Acuticoccus sp. MNP-M23 TaxID=3072793 RepID=UPI002815634E|nr:M20/M25/M40 family metallo-hydrolase [Acuticoccus sp. MNP-M23]WMS41492.1 M20/M25/M40 family metallo-hydrolase [Acuticoccus sp. MNP-M23]